MRHVGDRIAAADDVVALRQMIIKDGVVPFDLAPVAVHDMGKLFRSGVLKMHGLAGKRTDSRRDKEQPGQQFRPIAGRADEAPDLVA
jgi:hypothetical protein